METERLRPKYEQSHALVIGINSYSVAPPLRYAVNDAEALALMLKERFGFLSENTHLLLNQDATRSAIIEHFMRLTSNGTGPNDRVVFFFAGHGCTIRSKRGDVGYLVPHDGRVDNLVSLVRWDELTRNADLIEAKHLFFIMDACYGGLAIMRNLSPGATRFLKDMLLRSARQVLTAGKANEQVSDSGGPLPDHSVFTGHLLEALGGKSADSEGLITANGVMTYVYHMVARDRDSHQTPHFGYLDGDGDFIFLAPQLAPLQKEERKDEDILVSIPAVFTPDNGEKPMSLIEQAKELLGDEKLRIRLSDLVTSKTREAMSLTAEDNFPVTGGWSVEQFVERLKQYESAISELSTIQALLSRWGTERHKEIISLPLRRLCGRLGAVPGTVVWIALRWYPSLLLLYNGGIASLAAENYGNLKALFHTPVQDPESSNKEFTAILAVPQALKHVDDAFKHLPGHERNFTPRSEYLFKLLQPNLDDLFFLGTDYQRHFDRFEVLFALEHAHQGHGWGPVGRFGWKYERGGVASPFHLLLSEAAAQGTRWPILAAGLFGGSLDRFNEVAKQYNDNILARLNWY